MVCQVVPPSVDDSHLKTLPVCPVSCIWPVLVGAQTVAGPTAAVEPPTVAGTTEIFTTLDEEHPVPVVIVHCKRYELPTVRPVITDVGEVSSVKVIPVPEITVHLPVPAEGLFPASVVVVAPQRVWSGPALAVVGAGATSTETVKGVPAQPFELYAVTV